MKKAAVLQNLIVLLVLLFPILAHAQPGDPGGDPDVPIDGGLSILAAAGISYIAKKGYDKRKKALENNTEK